MGHTVESLLGALDSLSIDSQQRQRRFTLPERQEIARQRFRDARQRRQDREDALLAQVSPTPVLPAQYIRSETNPLADPPVLWYGLPVDPATLAAYAAARGTVPDVAVRVLQTTCTAPHLACVQPVRTCTRALPLVLAFKSSLRPDIEEGDARVAHALRAELGVPADRPCLWHFDAEAYQRVEQLFRLHARRAEEQPVVCDDLLDSEVSDLELTESDVEL